MTIFIRLSREEDKEGDLAREIGKINGNLPLSKDVSFNVDVSCFKMLPGSPFCYWVSDGIRSIFSNFPSIGDSDVVSFVGLQTSADFRFLRLSWEVSGGRWSHFAKGGSFSPYYSRIYLIVAYSYEDQECLKLIGRYGRGATHYYKAGLTWSRRADGLSLRCLPAGCIFADKGPAAFVKGNRHRLILAMCSITNSKPFSYLVSLQIARTELAQSYEVGLIQQTPVPELTEEQEKALAALAHRAWSIKRGLDTVVETSHAFTLPALLADLFYSGGEAAASVKSDGDAGRSLQERANRWLAHVSICQAAVAGIQEEVDSTAFDLYGIDGEDRVVIEAFDAKKPQAGAIAEDGSDDDSGADEDDDTADEDDDVAVDAPAEDLAVQLLSWAVGVAFGRFDLRLALGTRPLPAEPDPFDPLPALSPGMLAEADPDYPLALPDDGLLLDDDGHPLDLVSRTRAVFDQVFGDEAEARWQDAARLVGCDDGDPRPWFRRVFFSWHIKRYSKSRRKAPVYWQFSVPSARFSIWLWVHKSTPDTFHRIAALVERKISAEAGRLDRLRAEAGDRPGPAARKLLDEQEGVLDELRALHDEVRRVAPLWNPDFDDGVIINFAPLWRLVPQAKAWQKDVRACWDKLAAGAYDWSALARRFWPDRVAEQCQTDRSLAIAHGVEDEFWMLDEDGKWVMRPEPLVSIDQLVERWRSAAVQDALDTLASAPISEARSRARSTGGGTRRTVGPSQEAIDGLATREVVERTGLSEAECKSVLDVLSKIGDAEKRGAGRGTRWYASTGDKN